MYLDIEYLILIVLLLLARYVNIKKVYRYRMLDISYVNISMVCQYVNGMLIYNHNY